MGTSCSKRTFAGGHENRDPSVSDDAWSCVNDDCFDLPAFANRKFHSEKKSDIGGFEPSGAINGCII